MVVQIIHAHCENLENSTCMKKKYSYLPLTCILHVCTDDTPKKGSLLFLYKVSVMNSAMLTVET